MAPPIRNIFGQVKNKIDPRFMMDDRRIVIANFSKGRLGDDKANLLGALLVTQFQRAAMERADGPESSRAISISTSMNSTPFRRTRSRRFWPKREGTGSP